jgi:hypothetical protein
MVDSGFDGSIEVVRGQLSDARAEQVFRFWSREEALEEDAARERLPEVVCLLIDEAGQIAGVNSVYAAEVPLVGARRFWIYRNLLVPEASSAEAPMLNAAFTALEDEFESDRSGPIGICRLVADPTERRPEAIWPETKLMYAGNLDDGRQVRIRYFWDAIIGPGLPSSPSLDESRAHEYALEDRYRLELLGETDAATHADVIALWERETALPAAEVARRVHEVLLVAIEEREGVVGVSSAFLARNPQLRMDLWNYRAFVAASHRNSNLAVRLAVEGRELLERRFVSGEDTRAPGIIYEVENEGLKKYFNRALWIPADVTFIGENERGDHVRIRYFPGALASAPPKA